MQLSKNENFIKEFQEFSSKIERVTDQSVKKELLSLLDKLMTEVKSIDKQHQDMFVGNRMMESVADHRDNLKNIRKKLAAKLEDCDRAKLIN